MAAPWQNISYPRALLILLVVVTGSVFFVGGVTSGTVFGTYNPSWEGTSELRTLANNEGVETATLQNTTLYGSAKPNTTISFIFSPETEYSPDDAARVKQFIQAGGTVVIADDFGEHTPQLLADLEANTSLNGTLLRDERYHGSSPEMPRIPQIHSHTYTTGINQLTFNRGTTLSPNGSRVIFASSNYSYLDLNQNGELDESETLRSRPVGTIETMGEGELIVVGDPSLFINSMLESGGNRKFARNLLQNHETALFDFSHTTGVPPLIALQHSVQHSLWIQILAGTLLIGFISYWGRCLEVLNYVVSYREPTQSFQDEPDREAIERQLLERFPEWDESQIKQVTASITRNRQDDRDTE